MRILRPLPVVLCWFAISASLLAGQTGSVSPSIPTAKAHVLVLGTFHMANPGKDLYNMHVDVLGPERQAQIVDVVKALEAFRPTKIAVEASAGSDQTNQRYRDYLAGKYALSAGELDQIGFRLAKNLGHAQLYPMDVKGDFPFEAMQDFARKNGKEQILNDALAEAPKVLDQVAKILNQGTVGQALLYLNDEAQVKRGQALYMAFAQFADGKEYPGPDLLAAWYGRNIRIFSNLRAIIHSPDERVLVIYGSGHQYWLERDVLDSGDLTLERASQYLH